MISKKHTFNGHRVKNIVEYTENVTPVKECPKKILSLIDKNYGPKCVWPFNGERKRDELSWKELISHAERISKADTSYPIIMNNTGDDYLVDGYHRLCAAVQRDEEFILVKYIDWDLVREEMFEIYPDHKK